MDVELVLLHAGNFPRSYGCSPNGSCTNWRVSFVNNLSKTPRPSCVRDGVTKGSCHAGCREKDGVIILDHGSRRRESNQMLYKFVDMFRDKTGHPIVEPAHMELEEPSIKDAFHLCVQQGANRVIVSPFFLFPGQHWHQDIPFLTAEAAKEHPGVSYLIAAPLGLHELLVHVVCDRIGHRLSYIAGDAHG